LRDFEEAVDWFCSLGSVSRVAVLREVVRYLMQAHVTAQDGREGLLRSGVKPTVTPAVLIAREPTLEQMGKIVRLPPSEHANSFRVLLSAFVVADSRRRKVECRGTCSHFWHHLGRG